MEPDHYRWSNMEEDNIQVHMEMSPLEDVSSQVPLASGTDVETTKDQGAPNDI